MKKCLYLFVGFTLLFLTACQLQEEAKEIEPIEEENPALMECEETNEEELYKETINVIPEFPVWVYYGNNLNHLKENMILPDRNEPCICGSGKKFKNCCEKLFK